MHKKVLIIDDDPVIVHLFEASLKRQGYEVLIAFDGFNGYELARNTKPDLILLDIMMPSLNGYSVCGFLKQNEEYKDIPVIMVTTEKLELLKDFDDLTRPQGYFIKPVNVNEVLGKVEELIGT